MSVKINIVPSESAGPFRLQWRSAAEWHAGLWEESRQHYGSIAAARADARALSRTFPKFTVRVVEVLEG